MIELGRQLYFDKRLSKNDSQSCNTCHAVDNKGGGVDNEPTSPGAFGKRGDRNSPTTLNAGFHFVQFWDGRAKDLFLQAKGPNLNPVEMAMPAEAEVVKASLPPCRSTRPSLPRPSRRPRRRSVTTTSRTPSRL